MKSFVVWFWNVNISVLEIVVFVSREECMFFVRLIVNEYEFVCIFVKSFVWKIVYYVCINVRIDVFIVDVLNSVWNFVCFVGLVCWYMCIKLDKEKVRLIFVVILLIFDLIFVWYFVKFDFWGIYSFCVIFCKVCNLWWFFCRWIFKI